MTKKDPQKEMNKILFTNLVSMLGSSAMQQMGKLVNPMTNKTEVSLEGAQVTIDMIAMIQQKTQGNLESDEQKMIDELLSMLQMNFVETSKNPPSQGSSSPHQEASAEATADKTEGQADEAEEKTEGPPSASSDEAGPSSSKDSPLDQDASSAGKLRRDKTAEQDAAAKKKDPKYHKSYGE